MSKRHTYFMSPRHPESQRRRCRSATRIPQAQSLSRTRSSAFGQNHIDAQHRSQNQNPQRVVGGHLIRDLQHVVVGTGEQLFSQPGPLLGHLGQADPVVLKVELPRGPFAFERAELLVVFTEDAEVAVQANIFCLKPPTRSLLSSRTSTLDTKKDVPRLTPSTGSPSGVVTLTWNGVTVFHFVIRSIFVKNPKRGSQQCRIHSPVAGSKTSKLLAALNQPTCSLTKN